MLHGDSSRSAQNPPRRLNAKLTAGVRTMPSHRHGTKPGLASLPPLRPLVHCEHELRAGSGDTDRKLVIKSQRLMLLPNTTGLAQRPHDVAVRGKTREPLHSPLFPRRPLHRGPVRLHDDRPDLLTVFLAGTELQAAVRIQIRPSVSPDGSAPIPWFPQLPRHVLKVRPRPRRSNTTRLSKGHNNFQNPHNLRLPRPLPSGPTAVGRGQGPTTDAGRRPPTGRRALLQHGVQPVGAQALGRPRSWRGDIEEHGQVRGPQVSAQMCAASARAARTAAR